MTGRILRSLILLGAAGAVSLVATTAAVPAAGATAAPSSATAVVAAAADPVGYADRLVRAWGRGDRPAANGYATPRVVADLFNYSDPGGVTWARIALEGAAGTIFVTYRDLARGGTLILGVSDVLLSQGDPHAVYTDRFSQAHPIGAVTYADRLVRAWGRGDRTAAARYANPAVLDALFRFANPGGRDWVRTLSEGAAGTTFVTYRNLAGSGTVVLGVGNAAEADGQLHAVYRAQITH